MKGIEGVPVRIMLSVFLMAVVLVLTFYEVQAFQQFNQQRQFTESVASLVTGMNSLAQTSDPGSFMMITLNIPPGSTITLDNTTNKITATYQNQTHEYNITGTLLWTRAYSASKRQVQLYYGDPGNSTDQNLIAFTP